MAGTRLFQVFKRLGNTCAVVSPAHLKLRSTAGWDVVALYGVRGPLSLRILTDQQSRWLVMVAIFSSFVPGTIGKGDAELGQCCRCLGKCRSLEDTVFRGGKFVYLTYSGERNKE